MYVFYYESSYGMLYQFTSGEDICYDLDRCYWAIPGTLE